MTPPKATRRSAPHGLRVHGLSRAARYWVTHGKRAKQWAQVPNFEIPDSDYVSMTFDMGTAAPWATLYFWQAHGERLYFTRAAVSTTWTRYPVTFSSTPKSMGGTANQIQVATLRRTKSQNGFSLMSGTKVGLLPARARVFAIVLRTIASFRAFQSHIGASTAADLKERE